MFSDHSSFMDQRMCQSLWIFVCLGRWEAWQVSGKSSGEAENPDPCLRLHQARGRGRVVARPDPEPYCMPVKPDFVFSHVSISPGTCLIVFLLSLPFPRPLGLPAGLTLTTLPSDRAAWIRLPAGLATCRWSTLRWGSTPSSLKTRSLFCGRNTETSSDFEEPGRVGGGEQEGPEDGVSGSLFPVHIRSAAELDCAKYPNKLKWSKWQKKEYKGK